MADQRHIDISAIIIKETDRAYLVDDGKIEGWVPKSQVEVFPEGTVGCSGYRIMTFVMPEWLAKDKGFI